MHNNKFNSLNLNLILIATCFYNFSESIITWIILCITYTIISNGITWYLFYLFHWKQHWINNHNYVHHLFHFTYHATYHDYTTCSVKLWASYHVYCITCSSGDSFIKLMTALHICVYPHHVKIFIWCTTSKRYHTVARDSERTHTHVWIWVWSLSLSKKHPRNKYAHFYIRNKNDKITHFRDKWMKYNNVESKLIC